MTPFYIKVNLLRIFPSSSLHLDTPRIKNNFHKWKKSWHNTEQLSKSNISNQYPYLIDFYQYSAGFNFQL